ncbi:MAG: DUF1631 family protein [Pseudohongiellaceae bacterium]
MGNFRDNLGARTSRTNLGLSEKIRWSLRERLCEQMRLLIADLFDETDDFLFASGQRGQFSQDSIYLKAMREIRAKQDLFEETFLRVIGENLEGTRTGVDKRGSPVDECDESSNAVFEKVEIDLALRSMERKALKLYATLMQQIEPLDSHGAVAGMLSANNDFLVQHAMDAFEQAQEEFNLPLEVRLVLLKLYEQHFLMKMEKLYLDTISILTKSHDEKFVDKLYSSSTVFYERRTVRRSGHPERHTKRPNTKKKSELVEDKVDAMVAGYCADTRLPTFVTTMLRSGWRNVLFIIGLNKGIDSREWDDAEQTAKKLSALVTGAGIDTARLAGQLKKGFKLIQYPAEEQATFLAELDLFVGRVSGRKPGARAPANSAEKAANAGARDTGASTRSNDNIIDSDDMDELVEMLRGGADTASSETDAHDSLKPFLTQVDNLMDGTVASFIRNGKWYNCKICRSTAIDNSFQVINSQGKVVLVRSRLGMAVSLRENQIRLATAETSELASRHTVLQAAPRFRAGLKPH